MKRRRISIVVAVFFIACVLLAGPANWLYQQIVYANEQKKAAAVVESLAERRPEDVEPEPWETASGWAITAYHNVCFSRSHVTLLEMKRFRSDVKAEFATGIDLATIDWIWRRLAQTGPHGKQYVERFEPQFREQMAAHLKSAQ